MNLSRIKRNLLLYICRKDHLGSNYYKSAFREYNFCKMEDKEYFDYSLENSNKLVNMWKATKKGFCDALPLIHNIAIYFLLLPPLYFTEPGLLLLYAGLATATILHWKFLNNECVLTKLEKENNPEAYKHAPQQGFVRMIFENIGLGFLNKQKYLTEKVLLILILISLYKVYIGIVDRKCKRIWR